ncbi:MAG: formate/nitrite transporter family protein [Betaproteobacteria bacterium]|nr:formate/nitrite transporter family protein [Betaproteobacteria bacterium]
MPAAEPKKEATRREADRVEERAIPPTPVIYDVVRRYGEEEMSRPAISLWWSGLAAGLSMSFSLLAEAILRMHLPEGHWAKLVVSFGYPVGFVMVVLARQQLFTENTITVVLPVTAEPTRRNFWRSGRVWGIVLAANLVGTLAAALLCTFTPVIDPALRDAMLAISADGMRYGWMETAFRSVTAGFLMATMVWLIPASDEAQFFVILLITYLIGAGGFPHIVAGSVESFLLVANGQLGFGAMLGGFTLPVLLGNIVGGTVLFALLSYAQVMKEI